MMTVKLEIIQLQNMLMIHLIDLRNVINRKEIPENEILKRLLILLKKSSILI